MSSIAWFYRVPRADLLDARGAVAPLLDRATDLGDDYLWSGYVMMNFVLALDEAGVNLGADLADEAEPDDETALLFFAVPDDLDAIESLDLNRLDEETLGMGLELDDDELREAVAESAMFLREVIAGTAPDEVVVIRIG